VHPARKSWDQILAEGAVVNVGSASHKLMPLRAKDFAELSAAIKDDNLKGYMRTTLGRVDSTVAASVHFKISHSVISDAMIIEACSGVVWASWVLRKSLELGGAVNAAEIVDGLDHADTMNKTAFVLQLSGLLYAPGEKQDDKAPDPTEQTGEP